MIISQGRKYIFVHIPKTGGTAVSLALEARAMADDILIGDTPKAEKRRGRLKSLSPKGRLWKHSTLSDIEGVVENFDGYFIFTLVRNPWDRAVSYYHWLREQSWTHPAVALAKASEFSAFLNHELIRTSFAQPYESYVTDSSGKAYEARFMRLEHLDADLTSLWDHLGFDLSPIEKVNVSKRGRDFRKFYSDADAALMGELASKDIERFGYAFDI